MIYVPRSDFKQHSLQYVALFRWRVNVCLCFIRMCFQHTHYEQHYTSNTKSKFLTFTAWNSFNLLPQCLFVFSDTYLSIKHLNHGNSPYDGVVHVSALDIEKKRMSRECGINKLSTRPKAGERSSIIELFNHIYNKKKYL